MPDNDTESGPQALRELARWVIRDGVDAKHIEDYMRRLLSNHLIELHASCRCEAIVVARCFADMGSRSVACHLCERAFEMEQTSSLFSASAPRRLKQRAVSSIFKRRVFGLPCGECRFSLLPEVIAATVYTGVSVLVLRAQCDDSTLCLTAASLYGLLGLLYASAAIRLICGRRGTRVRSSRGVTAGGSVDS
jgi:hypothetical protein